MLQRWDQHDFACIDIFNPQSGPIRIAIRADDSQSSSFGSRYNEEFLLRPGQNTITLSLRQMQTSDKLRALDLTQLKFLLIFAVEPRKRLVLFLDNFRLEMSPMPTAQPNDASVRAFDFGPASAPVTEGFNIVTAAHRYQKSLGYGWTSPSRLREFDNELPDTLCRDLVAGDPNAVFTNEFAVDLANGHYMVVVCGHSLLSGSALIPGRSYKLLAEGEVKCSVSITSADFFSEELLFRGINHDWWPEKDVWSEEILPKFPERSFEVRVADGQLNLTFEAMAVYWLAIYPIERRVAATAWLDSVLAARRREFYERSFYLEPYRPPKKPTQFRLAAARGQTVSAFLHSLQPPAVTWKNKPGSIQAELRAVRLMERPAGRGIYRIEPTVLMPVTNRPHAQQFCLTVRVSKEAKPGMYHGTVAGLPIELRVWPFELPGSDALDMTYGWFYEDPGEWNYHYAMFPDRARELVATREREFQDMVEHGFNSVQLRSPLPRISSGTRRVTLNTQSAEASLRAAQKAGLLKKHRAMMNTLFIARVLARDLGASEFSEPFLPPFREALFQLKKWVRVNRFPVLAYVVDEPREQMLNPWNRNFADTKRFLEIYRSVGLPTVVTLMADDQSGKSYLPLATLLDVVATHPWEKSRGLFDTAREGKPELWIYNAGLNRFTFGFYPWAVGAKGRWEWHYQWWTQAYDPFARTEEDAWSSGTGAVMPSPAGPLPTAAYEKVRQGIDDYRYVFLLERLIRRGEGRKAQDAGRFLDELRGRIPRFLDGSSAAVEEELLETWRNQVAGWIIALSDDAAGRAVSPDAARHPD